MISELRCCVVVIFAKRTNWPHWNNTFARRGEIVREPRRSDEDSRVLARRAVIKSRGTSVAILPRETGPRKRGDLPTPRNGWNMTVPKKNTSHLCTASAHGRVLLGRLGATFLLGVLAAAVPACAANEEPGTDSGPEPSPPAAQGVQRPGTVTTGKVLLGGEVVDATYVFDDAGYAVTNGDVLVTPLTAEEAAKLALPEADAAESVATSSQALATITGSLWPVVSGYVNVPYVINAGLSPEAQKSVTIALSRWTAAMKVKFVSRTTQADYVSFDPGSGCSSFVGKIGGKQTIQLAAGCASTGAVHEIGHALGAFHEHTRSDRDSFVTLNTAVIDPAMLFNFDKYSLRYVGKDNGAYDYRSIMHYDSFAFSIDKVSPQRATMVQKTTGKLISRNVALSTNDVCWMKRRYFPTTTCTIGPSTCKATLTGNETRATAVDIGGSKGLTVTRNLCRADVQQHDVDWFKFSVVAGNTISINGELDQAAISLTDGNSLIASALVVDWRLSDAPFTYMSPTSTTLYLQVSGGDQAYKLKVGW